MQNRYGYKKLLLCFCIFALIFSGFSVQVECNISGGFGNQAPAVLQIPKAHTQRSDMFDKGQWIACDDVASHIDSSDKKSQFARKNGMHLLSWYSLLTGLGALAAVLFSGVFHDSSCSTHGLLRLLSFILDADGQKDNFSFSFIS